MQNTSYLLGSLSYNIFLVVRSTLSAFLSVLVPFRKMTHTEAFKALWQ